MQYIICFNLRFLVACKILIVTNNESNHDMFLMIKFVSRNFDCSGKFTENTRGNIINHQIKVKIYSQPEIHVLFHN